MKLAADRGGRGKTSSLAAPRRRRDVAALSALAVRADNSQKNVSSGYVRFSA
jgi:hypothetical protein